MLEWQTKQNERQTGRITERYKKVRTIEKNNRTIDRMAEWQKEIDSADRSNNR